MFSTGAVFAVDDSHRRARMLAFGLTAAGRALLVVLDEPTVTGTAYVVTARPMTTAERRDYDEETKP